ncbi:MAG: adenine phosphoribosyltransferase [Eubacteriaceae bacterium]|nr:adenine phosphoribosyltransferase [Eubacteriaceae bacterium]
MDLSSKIRVIEGFPIDGISFKDITTILKDKEAFSYTIDTLAGLVGEGIDYIASPEARGFIFGTALADRLGAGFIPIRKRGKLPAETIKHDYELEYGTDTLEVHADAFENGGKVAVVDDLLATGGTLNTCCKLVEKAGGTVERIVVLIELTSMNGREKLEGYDIRSVLTYDI